MRWISVDCIIFFLQAEDGIRGRLVTGVQACALPISFIEPRIDACCQLEPGHMTHPLMPELTAGTMLIWPGNLLHAVSAYAGTKPRITIAWNINDRELPGSLGDAFKSA